MSYDLAVIGAGVLGLAHALAAARRGKRVVVIDRDAQANGASIRNFGFVTVNGQQAGDCWALARRTREVWAEVAEAARIPILHRTFIQLTLVWIRRISHLSSRGSCCQHGPLAGLKMANHR